MVLGLFLLLLEGMERDLQTKFGFLSLYIGYRDLRDISSVVSVSWSIDSRSNLGKSCLSLDIVDSSDVPIRFVTSIETACTV